MGFFILKYPIGSNEIESFLCRVVASKTDPQDRFAPFSIFKREAYNTNNIIPDILPEPTSYYSCTATINTTKDKGIGIKRLRQLYNSVSSEHGIALKSKIIRRYILTEPKHTFQSLMKDTRYKEAVQALLDNIWPYHAYLITGFLTAKDTYWVWGDNHGFDSRHAFEEQIIAVRYSYIKLSYSRSANFISRVPSLHQAVQAKPYHLVIGKNRDEDMEEISYDFTRKGQYDGTS